MYFCREILIWRRDAAVIASLMFASHPIHTEAVSSIVGRADVLCCVLYLSSLIACSRNSLAWQVVSLLCAGMALLAKEQGVTVLGVCLTYQFLLLMEKKSVNSKPEDENCKCRQKRCRPLENVSSLQIHARIIVLLSAMLVLIYVRGWILNGNLPQFGEQDNPAAFSRSWTTRLLSLLYLPAFNFWLMLCPLTLSYDWQMGSIPMVESLYDWRNVATVSYLISLAALFLAALLKPGVQGIERRRVCLSLSLMIFSFLPASNLLVTVGFVVAERVLYIPSLGFCLLVSHGLQKLMQRGPLVAWLCRAGALVLILLFVLKTMARNNVWSSRESLFTSGLESVPNNAKVHYNYANYKKDTGDKFAAIEHYTIALRLWPTHASSHNNLGTLLDDTEEAEKHFRQALSINPCHSKAYYNLASIYSKKGQRDVAEKLLLRAIHLDPEFVSAISALASLYGDSGDKSDEAERLHLWAVTLDPDNADALNNYGIFLEKTGRAFEAMTQYERAMTAQPNHTVAILNAARSLRTLDHSRRAEELYKKALEIQEDPQIMDNLGMLFFVSGRYQEARKMFQHLLLNYPERNDPKLHYAQLLIQERSYEQAEALLISVSHATSNREGFLHLAILYNLTNRTAEALDTILKALNMCSPVEVSCAKYHEEHGDILKDMDDFEAAEESYKIALMLDPKLARSHLNLAVIYHIKGNYTSAKLHYQEAYKLDSSPQVLLDNMRKLQQRLFSLPESTCWRTDSTCRVQ
ncbi:protein O-mannosyl-transferase TMTC1-like [Uloborus diversus]|uniref:protein O-mannosyl-transferase TMTC1-like n=1 Tax=Uloborus diversus TaxID=327109 RepID=UPI0024096404|nr:protein O-mannosyl-transferase TMTC1-like [Uloborus diversus]